MPATPESILALDVGNKRIGVALASAEARIAQPLTTLTNDDSFVSRLQELIAEHGVQIVVVGLPRNLSGEDTPQTDYVRQFVEKLGSNIDTAILLQDEALTSRQAEAELTTRGSGYTKEDVDSLSATYILEDYLGGRSHTNGGF